MDPIKAMHYVITGLGQIACDADAGFTTTHYAHVTCPDCINVIGGKNRTKLDPSDAKYVLFIVEQTSATFDEICPIVDHIMDELTNSHGYGEKIRPAVVVLVSAQQHLLRTLEWATTPGKTGH